MKSLSNKKYYDTDLNKECVEIDDVKEAIKEFMKEMVESESMSEELFISRLIINFEEIFGKELCSEVEE